MIHGHLPATHNTHTLGSLVKKASFPILSLSKYQFEVQLHQGTGRCHSPVFPKIQRVAAPTKPQPFCGSNPAAPVTPPEWPPPRKTVSNPVCWCCRLHPGKHNKTVSNPVCWCCCIHPNKHNKTVSNPVCWCCRIHPGKHKTVSNPVCGCCRL